MKGAEPSLPGRIVRSLGTWLCWCVLLLTLLAGLDAGLEIHRQRHLQHGLWFLSAELLRDALLGHLAVAAAAAFAVTLLPFATRRFGPIVHSRWPVGLALPCAALLAGGVLLAERPRLADAGSAPNLLLISVDTLRADHLGAYGHERPTSPAIDRLAESGVLFEHALAQSHWTLPSMASLHTGLYPSEHGARRAHTSLSPSVLMLAEVLRNAGYRALGVVSHVFVARRFGFGQGMQAFDESQVLGHDAVTSEEITRRAIGLVREQPGRPFFLWTHYFDPHFSYVRHAEHDFAGRTYTTHVSFEELSRRAEELLREGAGPEHPYLREVRAIYDEEIAHTDRWIGRLVEQVWAASAGRPLVIVLVADHGELFLEHDAVGHGRELYEELIHVPLIFAGDLDPALRGRRVERSVETASVPRTLLGLVGIETAFFPGEDLLAADPEGEPRALFSEGSNAWTQDGLRRAVIADGWKLIHNLDDGGYELYHLARDPRESRNLWDDPGPELQAIRARLRSELESHSPSATSQARRVELDAAERQLLHELGYVEEPGPSDPAPPAPEAPAPD